METNNNPNQPNTSASSQPPALSGMAAMPGATPKPETAPPPASPPPVLPAPAKLLNSAAATPASPEAFLQAAAGLPVRGKPVDKICWRSGDGLVTVSQKVTDVGRFPPHRYPVIVLECVPKEGQRIRQLPTNDGLEIMLAHREIEQYLEAIALADGKVRYEVSRRVPPKGPARKSYWDKINAARHQRKSREQAGGHGPSH